MSSKKIFNRVGKAWNSLPGPLKIVAGGLVIWGGYKAVKALRSRITPKPLPNAGQGIPVVGYTQTGQPVSWSPAKIVEDNFSAMTGLGTFSGTKDEAWKEIINLPSADMLTATYNAFNSDPRSGGETLTQWIDSEYYYDYFSGVKDQVLSKLRGAGLN